MKRRFAKLALHKSTVANLDITKLKGGEPVATHLRTECAISYGICFTDASCPQDTAPNSLQSCPGGICPTIIPSWTCVSRCEVPCWMPSGFPPC